MTLQQDSKSYVLNNKIYGCFIFNNFFFDAIKNAVNTIVLLKKKAFCHACCLTLRIIMRVSRFFIAYFGDVDCISPPNKNEQ